MSDANQSEQLEQQCQELIELVERCIDFKYWRFQRAYVHISVGKQPYVIYDSEWCRVMFVSSGWDAYVGDVISVHYGRLHASNDANVMMWNSNLCYCWHDINNILYFLDGLSPQEAINQLVLGQRPLVMYQYEQSEIGKSPSRKQPEWMARMHNVVWEHYGNRFFELLDLRQPDLWEQYTSFVREFHSLRKSKKISGFPARDKIC